MLLSSLVGFNESYKLDLLRAWEPLDNYSLAKGCTTGKSHFSLSYGD